MGVDVRSSLDDEVAEALEAPVELLPLLPELLADLDDLGGDGAEAVRLLRDAGLARGARVLDLGCGKGTAAILAARELGAHVLGVDGLLAFVEDARLRAERAGVADRCHFKHGDLRDALEEAERDPVDAALLMAVGRIPGDGDLAATIGRLRRAVKPGGLILIDDGYLAPGYDAQDTPERAEYEDYAGTVRALTAHGDTLAVESLGEEGDIHDLNESNNAAIRARGEALCVTHPQQADLIRAFVADQERLVALEDDGHILSATWVLRRAAD